MKFYAGGYLTFYMPDQQPDSEHALSERVELSKFLAELGIPIAEVQLVILNGCVIDLEQAQIQDQDIVKVFPGIDGG